MRKRNNHSRNPSRTLLIPAIAGMLLSAPTLARAQDDGRAGMFSGGYLHELCRSDEKGRETVKGGHTACQAYIAGVVDYHKLMKSLGTQPLMDFCVPNNESMKRLQSIVWLYFAKHPQHADFIAAPTVTMALYEYYPCPAQGKRSSKKLRK